MEPLICPQCGGQITSYLPGQVFTICQYCSTTFRIDTNKERDVSLPPPVYKPIESEASIKPQYIIRVLAGVFAVFGIVILIALASGTRSSRTPPYRTPYTAPSVTPTPSPTPNTNLLEFGATGTGDGLFKDANTITVDKQGRIYVGDDTLRVQQFDANGQFLRVIQVPSETKHYDRARTIDKIAAGDNGRLYVAVGGTILIYEEGSTEPDHTIHAAPSYVQDFALRSDGGLALIENDDKIETLVIVSKANKVLKHISGFHTNAADAALSPRETGLSAIRIAVDGAGNIFSVYAFGDLGGYSISYNTEELMIFRFTPEGKYVNKFVESMYSCGIEVDNQSRIYVSEGSEVDAYTNTGQPAGTIKGDLSGITAFALDKDNNLYVLMKDKVVKKAAIPSN
jgi:hypothetical protein